MTTRTPLRRGGQFVDEAGLTVTWSVAEGRRGRRWRWVVGEGRGAIVTHTLELDPVGRFARLESATGSALLTLHREADGSVHGNRVSEAGVDHLSFPAPAPGLVLVGRGPIGDAVFVSALRRDVDVASGPVLEVDGLLEIDDHLGVRVGRSVVHRLGPRTYRLVADAGTREVEVDADGTPASRSRTTAWSLEGG